MKPEIGSIGLSTGIRLEFAKQGTESGLPVVLLHGITDSWRSYELVLPYLPSWIRAYALSMRGHGDSSRPETGYAPSDYAADVAAFLDAQGIDRALVVGHSLGSVVAQRVAIDHGERVLGLVLVGSTYTLADKPDVEEMWRTTLSTLEDPVDPSLARDFQESTLAQPIPPGYLETVVGESLKLPARIWRAAFRAMLEVNHLADLGRIATPTLVIWGDRDAYMLCDEQETLVRTIPGARLSIYSGAGHALHWEEPERFAKDLTIFASRLSPASVVASSG